MDIEQELKRLLNTPLTPRPGIYAPEPGYRREDYYGRDDFNEVSAWVTAELHSLGLGRDTQLFPDYRIEGAPSASRDGQQIHGMAESQFFSHSACQEAGMEDTATKKFPDLDRLQAAYHEPIHAIDLALDHHTDALMARHADEIKNLEGRQIKYGSLEKFEKSAKRGHNFTEAEIEKIRSSQTDGDLVNKTRDGESEMRVKLREALADTGAFLLMVAHDPDNKRIDDYLQDFSTKRRVLTSDSVHDSSAYLRALAENLKKDKAQLPKNLSVRDAAQRAAKFMDDHFGLFVADSVIEKGNVAGAHQFEYAKLKVKVPLTKQQQIDATVKAGDKDFSERRTEQQTFCDKAKNQLPVFADYIKRAPPQSP